VPVNGPRDPKDVLSSAAWMVLTLGVLLLRQRRRAPVPVRRRIDLHG
jgi:MYXO-CTERM domain-containing protein